MPEVCYAISMRIVHHMETALYIIGASNKSIISNAKNAIIILIYRLYQFKDFNNYIGI